MIRARFMTDRGQLCGFHISGHAGAGQIGEDIVCAAVSSAVYMTANTITEILHVPARIYIHDGRMRLRVTDRADECQAVLAGLQLHLQALQEQYPKGIQLMNTEV